MKALRQVRLPVGFKSIADHARIVEFITVRPAKLYEAYIAPVFVERIITLPSELDATLAFARFVVVEEKEDPPFDDHKTRELELALFVETPI